MARFAITRQALTWRDLGTAAKLAFQHKSYQGKGGTVIVLSGYSK